LFRVYYTTRLSQGNNKGPFHSHDGGTYTVIYKWVLLSLEKTTSNNTNIITVKPYCTILVSAELLIIGWLCRWVPYLESAPLHNARKTNASEVQYSQKELYQVLYTLHIHYIHCTIRIKYHAYVCTSLHWSIAHYKCQAVIGLSSVHNKTFETNHKMQYLICAHIFNGDIAL